MWGILGLNGHHNAQVLLAFEALGWTTASCWYDESLDPLRNSCGCCFQLSQYAGEGVAASTAKG